MPQTRRRRKSNQTIPKEPDVPQPRTTVNPGTDFYTFINGNWLRHAHIPPYMSSYGVSEEIEDQIHDECMDILLKARAQIRHTPDRALPRPTYLLGTLTESALNTKSQQLNVNFIRSMVAQYQCARDSSEVGRILGECCRYRVPSQFFMTVLPMEVQSSTLRFAIGPGHVGLPDPSYYIDPEPTKLKAIEKYSKLLKALGDDFQIPGLEQVIGLEKLSAPILFQARKETETLMKGSSLLNQYPAIPWVSILQAALGWTEAKFKQQSVLVLSKRWLQALNRWFRTLPLQQWKLWVSANLLLYVLPLLPPPYDEMEFELYGHFLKGQREKVPQKRLALKLAEEWLTASLGDMFIRAHVTAHQKATALELAEQIRKAAALRAGLTPWLEAHTRAKARSKVQGIYLGVAYPSSLDKEQKLLLNPEQLVQNVLHLGEADFKNDMEKIDTKLNIYQWDDAVFSVNAYYYNEGNRLILPAGILRWPFFHPSASDGWNYGGLGVAIGHEICHAFDNDGKDYDEEGNRNPWWSRAEIARYTKKVKALADLYSHTTYFGQTLNGYLTLSENIADLGGLDIALTALKLKLKGASPDVLKQQLRDFFMSYAVSWRTKEKKEKALQSLFMDVHAPPPARVNNIVTQFDEWYEAFDIQPGEKLYRDPQHRIRIF